MNRLFALTILALTILPIGLLLPGAVLANQGGEWRGLTSMNVPRQEIGAARIGGFVYVCGGLIASPAGATNTVEAYDIANDQWSFVAPMPAELDHQAVAATGGLLYVMGGYSGDFVARSGAYVYDPATNQWSTIASLPQPRGGCWAAEQGGRIYLFGGTGPGGGTVNSTFIYDPGTNQWSTGRDMPTARNHLVAVTSGAFIYVLGGRPPVTQANERYDPARNEWASMTPMPTARAAMAVAAIDGRIVVAGGETPMLHMVTEIYDVATNGWACGAPMAIPRHGVAAASLGDRMLCAAGGVVQGFSPTSAVDAYIPPPALAPVVFSMKLDGVEAARLTIERFDGRFFATISRNGRTPCENVGVSIDGPGMASFFCGSNRVSLVRQGAQLLLVRRRTLGSSLPSGMNGSRAALGCASGCRPVGCRRRRRRIREPQASRGITDHGRAIGAYTQA